MSARNVGVVTPRKATTNSLALCRGWSSASGRVWVTEARHLGHLRAAPSSSADVPATAGTPLPLSPRPPYPVQQAHSHRPSHTRIHTDTHSHSQHCPMYPPDENTRPHTVIDSHPLTRTDTYSQIPHPSKHTHICCHPPRAHTVTHSHAHTPSPSFCWSCTPPTRLSPRCPASATAFRPRRPSQQPQGATGCPHPPRTCPRQHHTQHCLCIFHVTSAQ